MDDTTTTLKRKRSSIEEVELLSEDQKRANHIASEQKRRNTIRGGFKELTEIIPTLKNINNSKSTILFKSVDYIKQLDKRNKSLKDKLFILQQRVKSRQEKRQMKLQQQQQGVPNSITLALLNHKNQQKQLELLQQQLRIQQALLTKHNIPLYSTGSISIPTMDDNNNIIHTNSLPIVNNNNHHQHQHHHHIQEHSYHHSHSQHHSEQQQKKITALVMPADDYPSFNIPADEEEEENNHSFRERLLSSGKLNHLRTASSSSTFML